MSLLQTQTVPPEGSLSRDIFFLGQAPTIEEMREGRPFVGRSGKEQNSLNLQAQIQRDDAYWSNIIKVRPPVEWLNENSRRPYNVRLMEIEYFIDLKKKPDWNHFNAWLEGEEALPPEGVSEDSKPFILESFKEFDAFEGNVIVPFGNEPLWILTGMAQITKRRGSIYEVRGKKVVPCVHPSFVLRSWSAIERRLAVLDLRRVKGESKTPEVEFLEREFLIYPSFNEAMMFMDECLSLSEIGFDIECMKTGGLGREMSCFGFATSPLRAMCIPLHSKGKAYFSESEELQIMQRTAQVLEASNVTKIGQNLVFDSDFVYTKFGILCKPIEDTMIANKVRFPDFPKGLDFLTRHYTREPYYKDEGKEWGAVKAEHEADFFLYNCKDCAYVMEIFPEQLKLLKKQDKENKL